MLSPCNFVCLSVTHTFFCKPFILQFLNSTDMIMKNKFIWVKKIRLSLCFYINLNILQFHSKFAHKKNTEKIQWKYLKIIKYFFFRYTSPIDNSSLFRMIYKGHGEHTVKGVKVK